MAEQAHSMATPISDAQLAEVKRMVEKPEFDGVGDFITEKLIARIETDTHTKSKQASEIDRLKKSLADIRAVLGRLTQMVSASSDITSDVLQRTAEG